MKCAVLQELINILRAVSVLCRNSLPKIAKRKKCGEKQEDKKKVIGERKGYAWRRIMLEDATHYDDHT